MTKTHDWLSAKISFLVVKMKKKKIAWNFLSQRKELYLEMYYLMARINSEKFIVM